MGASRSSRASCDGELSEAGADIATQELEGVAVTGEGVFADPLLDGEVLPEEGGHEGGKRCHGWPPFTKSSQRSANPGKKHGRRLEVPVAVSRVTMPEVCRERDHVARDAGVVGGAVRQGLVREIEPQVMKPGPRLAVAGSDAQAPDESTEDTPNRRGGELPAAPGQKNVRAGARLLIPALKILLEYAPRGRVQGEQADGSPSFP